MLLQENQVFTADDTDDNSAIPLLVYDGKIYEQLGQIWHTVQP